MNNLRQLIKRVEKKNSHGSFTIKIEDKPFTDVKVSEMVYAEGDLTKSYVKFVKDVFSGLYGEVTTKQVEALGDSIKADINDFPTSYRNKKSVIKEIEDGVYIHTSMNREAMSTKIFRLSQSIGGDVDWADEGDEKMIHGDLIADDIIETDSVYRRMITFHLERENLQEEVVKKITSLEFKRFCEDIDSDMVAFFFTSLNRRVSEWKEDKDKYNRKDYLD